jgi:hypothetical protein
MSMTTIRKQATRPVGRYWKGKAPKGAAELLSSDSEEGPVDVDATGGLDLLGEFDTWRLRELARIKWDNEAEIAREQEREEVE